MRHVYTIWELLTLNTNGYACDSCGHTWLDHSGSHSVAFTLTKGFEDCSHPVIRRHTITPNLVRA